MYNSELKSRYFEENESRNLTLAQYKFNFEKIQSEEERLNKDLCEFTSVEILDYYKRLCTPSLGFLSCLNSQFKIYAAWCQSQGLLKDNQNHYDEINRELLLSCVNYGLVNAKIITRQDLLYVLFDFKNPVDKFICLAIFEGILGKEFSELANLTMDSFEENNVHLSSGRILTVSDELIGLAYQAANTYYYYPIHVKGRCETYKCKDTDNRIVKVVVSGNNSADNVKYYVFSTKLKLFKKFYNMQSLGANALKESGRIEMIRNICNKEKIDAKTCLRTHPEIEYRYGKLSSYVAYIEKYRDYLVWE